MSYFLPDFTLGVCGDEDVCDGVCEWSSFCVLVEFGGMCSQEFEGFWVSWIVIYCYGGPIVLAQVCYSPWLDPAVERMAPPQCKIIGVMVPMRMTSTKHLSDKTI